MAFSYRCWAEVDLTALRDNLGWIRHQVGPNVKVMTVVKADAYGHGLKQIAAILMQSGTDLFGVATLTEARAIRSVGRGWPVLMLGACLPDEVETAVRDDIMVTISTVGEAAAISAAAKRLHKTAVAHLKIDTGMGRLGARSGEALAMLNRIDAMPGIRVEGIYTHYASVEDDAKFSRQQANAFRRLMGEMKKAGRSFTYLHANNSGGLLLEEATVYNTIRPGLLVYGILPAGKRRVQSGLKHSVRPALSWICRVSLVKKIAAGTSLSYGRTFIAPGEMRVATLTAGYADGYLRSGSNRSQVLIGGRLCPVVGRITMDQMLVDVSKVSHVKAGDEAVLIGTQGKRAISANDLAQWTGTIAWEVLTSINYRVPRIYKGGHAA